MTQSRKCTRKRNLFYKRIIMVQARAYCTWQWWHIPSNVQYKSKLIMIVIMGTCTSHLSYRCSTLNSFWLLMGYLLAISVYTGWVPLSNKLEYDEWFCGNCNNERHIKELQGGKKQRDKSERRKERISQVCVELNVIIML